MFYDYIYVLLSINYSLLSVVGSLVVAITSKATNCHGYSHGVSIFSNDLFEFIVYMMITKKIETMIICRRGSFAALSAALISSSSPLFPSS